MKDQWCTNGYLGHNSYGSRGFTAGDQARSLVACWQLPSADLIFAYLISSALMLAVNVRCNAPSGPAMGTRGQNGGAAEAIGESLRRQTGKLRSYFIDFNAV